MYVELYMDLWTRQQSTQCIAGAGGIVSHVVHTVLLRRSNNRFPANPLLLHRRTAKHCSTVIIAAIPIYPIYMCAGKDFRDGAVVPFG